MRSQVKEKLLNKCLECIGHLLINIQLCKPALNLEAKNPSSCVNCNNIFEKLFSFCDEAPASQTCKLRHFPARTQITSPNPHPPADGSLAGDDVTLAVIEAKVSPQLTDALTRQAVHAEVASVADTLRLPRPLVHLTLRVLITRLELTGVSLVTWK